MNNELEYKRVQLVNKPRFTITVWVYILEYCARSLCSIVHRAMWNGSYNTPLIFVTKKGNLHIQVSLTNGETRAAITDITIPRHQWVRLVFVFDRKKWKLTFNYGKEFNQTKSTEFSFDSTVYMDDTEGLFVIGGSDTTPGFSGFIGKLQWYRNKAVESDQIAYPDPHHPMFQLDFVNREIMCQRFKERNQRLFSAYKTKRNTISAEDSCQQFLYRYIQQGNQMEMTNKCLQSDEPIPKYHKHIRRIIKYQAAMKNTFILTDANRMLYEKGVKLMEKGLRSVKAALPILKQSACFGNYDAMFMVSVILNNGIGVTADEIQSQAYLLLSARGQHRLSSLSLGHKHMYGLDGVPVDKEQAYPYLKYVADTTREDKEIYKNTDVYTESIRLTDEDQIKQQTDEDGDIFHWLKFQAKKGVLSAQQNIGRALFWGSQGLKRNIHTALQYLRMSAETEDAQSMYDYGIILLRGHGTSVNETEAMTHIKKSAEKKNPSALNALGWYALNYDRNTTEAVKYFEEAYSLGCPDAAYNLGILHLTGGFPGKTVDADKALAYFNFAGARNQIDAGIQVASLNMKGTSRHRRHIQIGVEWARFIAEKNPALGLVLRKALKAYRNLDLQSSLFYYLMASDAGLEVASFNSAYLCESSQDGMATVIEKDCQWRNYNLSTLREKQFVHAYSLIKMGDFYWYGCGKKQNIEKAAEYYTQAALKGDPHALFNLGFMIEEDSKLTDDFWIKLKIPLKDRIERNRLLKSLYTRCQESKHTEAYIPCTVALYRILILEQWLKYKFILQVVGFVVVSVMAIFSVVMIYRHTNAGTGALLRTTI
ncbi:protein sel-1 homolog 3-like [Mytilus edulis]|uniref:protein sel-1 homolog 3-like n=1 Tax=Mytilus edulis TaxID=6550 RepID=UPI0039EE74FC